MPPQHYTVGPGTLTLGEVGSEQEIAAQITDATAEPSVESEDDIPVLTGEVVAGEDTETWVLKGNLLQDISTTGINTWSMNNTGTVQPFSYVPNDGVGRALVGDIKVRSLAIGGPVKKKAQSDFEFPIVGTPALGDVAP